MALIIPPRDNATYLRIDNVRVNQSPERRTDGAWTVPPTRPCGAVLFAYASAEDRLASSAPLWSAPFTFLLGDLGLLTAIPGTEASPLGAAYKMDSVTGPDLWAAVYTLLATLYPSAAPDHLPRAVMAGLIPS